MASIAQVTGARGRRALDAHVNIVPYIDLLMVLMVFLMICAVWTTTRALTSDSAMAAGGAPIDKVDPPAVVHIAVGYIEVDGTRFSDDNAKGAVAKLVEAKKPEQLDILVDDGVRLDRITPVMDEAKALGIKTQTLKPPSQ